MIDVPLLQSDDFVESAITRMREDNVAAVAVQLGNKLALLFAGAIGEALEQGASRLCEIPPEHFQTMGEPRPLAAVGTPNFLAPGPPSSSDEEQWGLDGYDFAGIARSSTSAMVVSRSEALTALIRHRLQCERNPSHLFPMPEVAAGSNCPKCVTTDGPPPKVY